MKKLFFLTFLLATTTFWAQTADGLVQNYLNAIGGDKLDQVHSILQKGVMNMSGMDFPTESYQDTSGKMYTKLNMMGQEITALAFDGQKGYMFDNATFGYKDIPDSLTHQFKEKAQNLFGYFYRYKQKGSQVKYLGKQKLDSINYDTVLLTLAKPAEGNIKELTVFFNPKTHLIEAIKIVKDGHIIFTKPQAYKTFDGIGLPTKIVTVMDDQPVMTIKLDEIKINPPAPDPSIFSKPKQ